MTSTSFEAIWSEYRSNLQRFLYSKVSNQEDADELLQEILLKVHQKQDALKSVDNLKSWMFQVAHNIIIDFYRKRKHDSSITSLDSIGDFVADNDEAPESVQIELSQCIVPFIHSLPVEDAELLTAIDLQGQSQRAIAEERGISYSTLKSRVQASRGKLRKLFDSCCDFTLDSQGNLAEFNEKSSSCKKC